MSRVEREAAKAGLEELGRLEEAIIEAALGVLDDSIADRTLTDRIRVATADRVKSKSRETSAHEQPLSDRAPGLLFACASREEVQGYAHWSLSPFFEALAEHVPEAALVERMKQEIDSRLGAAVDALQPAQGL